MLKITIMTFVGVLMFVVVGVYLCIEELRYSRRHKQSKLDFAGKTWK